MDIKHLSKGNIDIKLNKFSFFYGKASFNSAMDYGRAPERWKFNLKWNNNWEKQKMVINDRPSRASKQVHQKFGKRVPFVRYRFYKVKIGYQIDEDTWACNSKW